MNLTLRSVILVISGAIVLASCGKSPKCWGEDQLKGEILGTVDWPECFDAHGLPETQSVIRSHADFTALHECDGDTFAFDFSKYSILAQAISGSCQLKVKKDVTIDHDLKECFYTIEVIECGLCERLKIDYQWVKIPAIPEDYEVIFEVVEK